MIQLPARLAAGDASAWRRWLLLGLLVLAGGAEAAEPAKRRLRIGVPRDSAPLSYLDERTGKVVGFTVELLRAAAEVGGFEVELVPAWWSVNVPAFQAGRLDALAQIAQYEAPRYGHLLTIVQASLQGVLYSRPDAPPTSSSSTARPSKSTGRARCRACCAPPSQANPRSIAAHDLRRPPILRA